MTPSVVDTNELIDEQTEQAEQTEQTEQEQQHQGQAEAPEQAEATQQGEATEQTSEQVDPQDEIAPDQQQPSPADTANSNAADNAANVAAFEHELLGRIRKQESAVALAECEVEDRKESLKAAKERLEEEVTALRRLIRQRDERLPLFDQNLEESNAVQGDSVIVDVRHEPHPDDTHDPDAWRAVEISALDLPDSLVEKLYESEISTIGDLADYQTRGNQLTDLKGIGQAKADKIADALEKFWANHPTFTQASEGEQSQQQAAANETADETTDETAQSDSTEKASVGLYDPDSTDSDSTENDPTDGGQVDHTETEPQASE